MTDELLPGMTDELLPGTVCRVIEDVLYRDCYVKIARPAGPGVYFAHVQGRAASALFVRGALNVVSAVDLLAQVNTE